MQLSQLPNQLASRAVIGRTLSRYAVPTLRYTLVEWRRVTERSNDREVYLPSNDEGLVFGCLCPGGLLSQSLRWQWPF